MDRNKFIHVLCILEGFKSIFREYHWMTKIGFIHKLIDDIMNDLIEFQDNLGEEGFIVYGEILKGELNGIKVNTDSLIEALETLTIVIIKFKNQIEPDNGLIALCDDYLHTVNKSIYLAKMN